MGYEKKKKKKKDEVYLHLFYFMFFFKNIFIFRSFDYQHKRRCSTINEVPENQRKSHIITNIKMYY